VRVAALITGGSTAGDMAAQAALTLRLHDQGASWAVGAEWAVTLLLLANRVPALLFLPVVGRLADGVDSRRVMVCAGWWCAALCTGLAFARSSWLLLLLVAAIAVVSSAFTATLGALVPAMVGRAGVVKAGSSMRGAVMIGGVAGLAAGAAATEAVGSTTILLVDALSFAVLGTGALAIRARRGGPHSATWAANARVAAPEPTRESAAPRRTSWLLTASYAGVLLMVSTTNVAQVFFVRDVVGAGNVGYGLVSGCWTVGTALTLPVMRRVAPDPGRLVGVATLGELLVGFALAGCAVAAALPATAAFYVLGGCGACAMQIAVGAVLQLNAPEHRRGRQLAGYSAVVKVAGVAALVLGGLLLEGLGARGTYLLSGAGTIAVAALTWLLWRAGELNSDLESAPIKPCDQSVTQGHRHHRVVSIDLPSRPS
jgi:MFS family permease